MVVGFLGFWARKSETRFAFPTVKPGSPLGYPPLLYIHIHIHGNGVAGWVGNACETRYAVSGFLARI